MQPKKIGKREFIQHTSTYLKLVEEQGGELIITHHNKPDLVLTKFKKKSFKDLQGVAKITIMGDVNAHVLPGYDEW